ncbi:hypothetical protein JOF56_003951 [Kibdelosporangium banguiense]|uniref:Uncharacterized protein n=1 Tax=Kibdelosporangium banguiense TaxID=1365924 RepID=A0ABS4TGL0_9PSEU|nr:hypothetical protein [Kibdelosporangium banguiense]MBP2323566.1 hypothetical protein [Kibdelosporangium banguiense]
MTDKPLTGHFPELTQEDLDVDECKARAAADVLGGVLVEFHSWHIELEEVVDALERSVPRSERAAEAHRRLAAALDTCEAVVCSLSDARDVFDARWPRRATPSSSPRPA